MPPGAIEESLTLPSASTNEEELRGTILRTNRAPLVLAFAVVLLKYTMPEQPLSSRLSLAQAVVSVNSRSKAVSIGLQKGNSAEEDGWGHGQPQVRVMGRDIRVMKRWGYDWKEGRSNAVQVPDSQDTIKADESTPPPIESIADEKDQPEDPPALWGLDLEALRSSNERPGTGARVPRKGASELPIHTAESARSYLLKSFSSASSSDPGGTPKKKPTPSGLKSDNERNLALLLAALDMLYDSWAKTLSHQELDRRSWGWYVSVRPDVQPGVSGWGEKGELKLSKILDLQRMT